MMTANPQTSSAPKTAAQSSWDIDTSHTRAGFKVRHMMVSHVRGELGPVSGTVWFDEQAPERSRVEVKIDLAGLDTRDPKRDEHLKSADFFDAASYPSVSFVSTRISVGKDGGYLLTGDLTIRGVTRAITLEVEPLAPAATDPWGNVKRGASAHGSINRKDFGLGWNVALEAGGVLVGEEVKIELDVELALRK